MSLGFRYAVFLYSLVLLILGPLQISGAKSLPMGPNDRVRFNIGLPELAPIHNFPKEIPEPILITEAEAQHSVQKR